MNYTKLLYLILFISSSSIVFSQEKFKIAVVGDTPYKSKDWKILKAKFQQLEDSGYNLLVHVGDIKRGVLPCFRRRYRRVSKLLNFSTVPYLIIPGDNEYNDCYCRGPKRALKLWRNNTLSTDFDNQFNISRSSQLPENFSFVKDSVLLIGINNVGGRIHDSIEWKERTLHNIAWVKSQTSENTFKSIVFFSHASPRKEFGLYDYLKQFSLSANHPVWFVQGDIHSYSIKENWNKTKMTRVVVDNGNEIDLFRTIIITYGILSIE